MMYIPMGWILLDRTIDKTKVYGLRFPILTRWSRIADVCSQVTEVMGTGGRDVMYLQIATELLTDPAATLVQGEKAALPLQDTALGGGGASVAKVEVKLENGGDESDMDGAVGGDAGTAAAAGNPPSLSAVSAGGAAQPMQPQGLTANSQVQRPRGHMDVGFAEAHDTHGQSIDQ
jgi:hypothetical protein